MNFNKNNSDIIDAEFVVDSTSKNSEKQVNCPENLIKNDVQNSESDPYSNNQRHAFKNFSFNINNKGIHAFSKPKFLTLIILSPIIILILIFAVICFLFVLIFFTPKIIKALKKGKKSFFYINSRFR